MPQFAPAIAAFFTSGVGEAVAGGLASGAVGYGISRLAAPSAPKIGIPPPPGAALIDPAGQTAAADARRRAAASGGLGSTLTQAGSAPSSPTGGGKALLGQ
jgi:hypothetical protein